MSDAEGTHTTDASAAIREQLKKKIHTAILLAATGLLIEWQNMTPRNVDDEFICSLPKVLTFRSTALEYIQVIDSRLKAQPFMPRSLGRILYFAGSLVSRCKCELERLQGQPSSVCH